MCNLCCNNRIIYLLRKIWTEKIPKLSLYELRKMVKSTENLKTMLFAVWHVLNLQLSWMFWAHFDLFLKQLVLDLYCERNMLDFVIIWGSMELIFVEDLFSLHLGDIIPLHFIWGYQYFRKSYLKSLSTQNKSFLFLLGLEDIFSIFSIDQ